MKISHALLKSSGPSEDIMSLGWAVELRIGSSLFIIFLIRARGRMCDWEQGGWGRRGRGGGMG